MGLFYRFLLGHLLGDFVFQGEWLFKLRSKYLARIYHGLIVGFITLVFTLPYFEIARTSRLLLVLGYITLAHIVIDLAKAYITLKLGYDSILFFLVDQALHLASIYIGYRIYPGLSYDENVNVVVLLCWVIGVMWATPIFLYFLDNAFRKSRVSPYEYYKEHHHGFGLWERGTLFLALALGGRWFWLLPIGILPRVFILLNSKSEKIPIWDWIGAVLLALVYRATLI